MNERINKCINVIIVGTGNTLCPGTPLTDSRTCLLLLDEHEIVCLRVGIRIMFTESSIEI